MKDNNSIDTAGFFFSQADIDKINKNNAGNSDPEWFDGIINENDDSQESVAVSRQIDSSQYSVNANRQTGDNYNADSLNLQTGDDNADNLNLQTGDDNADNLNLQTGDDDNAVNMNWPLSDSDDYKEEEEAERAMPLVDPEIARELEDAIKMAGVKTVLPVESAEPVIEEPRPLIGIREKIGDARETKENSDDTVSAVSEPGGDVLPAGTLADASLVDMPGQSGEKKKEKLETVVFEPEVPETAMAEPKAPETVMDELEAPEAVIAEPVVYEATEIGTPSYVLPEMTEAGEDTDSAGESENSDSNPAIEESMNEDEETESTGAELQMITDGAKPEAEVKADSAYLTTKDQFAASDFSYAEPEESETAEIKPEEAESTHIKSENAETAEIKPEEAQAPEMEAEKSESASVPAKTIIYERAKIEAALASPAAAVSAESAVSASTESAISDPSEPERIETVVPSRRVRHKETSRGLSQTGSAHVSGSSEKQPSVYSSHAEDKQNADKHAADKHAAGRAAEKTTGRAAKRAAERAERSARKEELRRQKQAYRGEGPAQRIVAIVIGILLVASAAAALIYLLGNGKYVTEYVAGNSNLVQVYAETEQPDGSGSAETNNNSDSKADAEVKEAVTDSGMTLSDAGTLVRGTKVRRYSETETLETETPDKVKLCRISVIDPKSGESAEYFINEENLTEDPAKAVQETDVWARTPATIYEREYGPAIASFAPKGTHLRVIGYDKLLDNGYINMYKVEYDPVDTDEEDKAEGFVYGKYMAATQEEAEEPYNEHGETDNARKEKFSYELYGGNGENLDWYPYEKTKIKGNKFCKNARAMYLNSYAAVHPDAWLKIIEDTDCNAVVLDLKDGPLTFKSETAKELSPTSYKNAYASEDELRKGIDKYRDAGVYLIGRIVVFNDQYYAKDHPEDCIKYGSDRSWPSAFSRDVWEYNVRLAQEAVEKFGFNEIQFDYVRFPEASFEMSKSGAADFRNKYDEEKAQAVQNFCFYACDQLREVGVYTSVDVFGEAAYSYVPAYGQYWASISNIVDAISAMPYTDHFSGEAPWEHPYDSVLRWAKSAAKRQKRIEHPAAARTWITGYNTPYWDPTVDYDTKRMKAQIRALKDAGLKGGFIPWNAVSDLDKYNQYKDIWNK